MGFPRDRRLRDGGPAPEARLAAPTGIALSRDGSLYIADAGNDRVRKVTRDGVIYTFAGGGQAGLGDNGPASKAKLSYPIDLTEGPDGSLYVADSGHHRLRRISPEGIITTVAGTGESGFAGDGGPADLAKLNSPEAVAIGPDGSLYIADRSNYRVRRVDPSGIITTVAGGSDGDLGDGGQATEARLGPKPGGASGSYRGTWPSAGLVIGPRGAIYIGDKSNQRVRRVDRDNIIGTLIGPKVTVEEGAEQKLSWITGMDLSSDGTLYVTNFENRIYYRTSGGEVGLVHLGDSSAIKK